MEKVFIWPMGQHWFNWFDLTELLCSNPIGCAHPGPSVVSGAELGLYTEN